MQKFYIEQRDLAQAKANLWDTVVHLENGIGANQMNHSTNELMDIQEILLKVIDGITQCERRISRS